MRLYGLFNESELQKQIVEGMIKITCHPTDSLEVVNYTQKAQFTPELWNHVTDICRGLIYDPRTLELVARPFSKFWNLGDSRHPETLPANLPATMPMITRKMDGSLGIAYKTQDGWAVATRGSFSSEQAIWATRWLRSKGQFKYEAPGYTPLFEIVYPENQIVVKYDYSGLILLALVNIETGEELSYCRLQDFGLVNDFRVVERFDKPLDGLSEEDDRNEEGYVVAWNRVGQAPLRVKIKYATYCRLHRLLTQTNAVTVWEMLRDGSDITALTVDVPQEFKSWLAGVQTRLQGEFKKLKDQALEAMLKYLGEKNVTLPGQRKEFALYAVKQQPVTAILFAMLDGKDYAQIIWKMIRPRGDEKTFKVDVDI